MVQVRVWRLRVCLAVVAPTLWKLGGAFYCCACVVVWLLSVHISRVPRAPRDTRTGTGPASGAVLLSLYAILSSFPLSLAARRQSQSWSRAVAVTTCRSLSSSSSSCILLYYLIVVCGVGVLLLRIYPSRSFFLVSVDSKLRFCSLSVYALFVICCAVARVFWLIIAVTLHSAYLL